MSTCSPPRKQVRTPFRCPARKVPWQVHPAPGSVLGTNRNRQRQSIHQPEYQCGDITTPNSLSKWLPTKHGSMMPAKTGQIEIIKLTSSVGNLSGLQIENTPQLLMAWRLIHGLERANYQIAGINKTCRCALLIEISSRFCGLISFFSLGAFTQEKAQTFRCHGKFPNNQCHQPDTRFQKEVSQRQPAHTDSRQ